MLGEIVKELTTTEGNDTNTSEIYFVMGEEGRGEKSPISSDEHHNRDKRV